MNQNDSHRSVGHFSDMHNIEVSIALLQEQSERTTEILETIAKQYESTTRLLIVLEEGQKANTVILSELRTKFHNIANEQQELKIKFATHEKGIHDDAKVIVADQKKTNADFETRLKDVEDKVLVHDGRLNQHDNFLKIVGGMVTAIGGDIIRRFLGIGV